MNHQRNAPAGGVTPLLAAMAGQLQARGLAGAAAALLDAFEPLTVLGAQALWMAQPVAGLASPSWRAVAGDLAAALETPEGVRALCAALRAANPPSGD